MQSFLCGTMDYFWVLPRCAQTYRCPCASWCLFLPRPQGQLSPLTSPCSTQGPRDAGEGLTLI